MSESSSLDQAIYLIAKELTGYLRERGGQVKPGAGLKLSIAYTLLKWIEKEYGLGEGDLTGVIKNGIILSHNEIAVGETVAQKNVEKVTVGLVQRFEVTNQALRGIPIVPAPELSSSQQKKGKGVLGKVVDKARRII